MSIGDLRIVTHAGEVLDTHTERVGRILSRVEAILANERKRPTVEGCSLFVQNAWKTNPRAFPGWYLSGTTNSDALLAFWLNPVREKRHPLTGEYPVLLLSSRRGRKRIIAWAEEVVAAKHKQDKQRDETAALQRISDDLGNDSPAA